MTDSFERIVTIVPAYDCLTVQPCVKGSTECGTRPGASHGRGDAELSMTLRGTAGEVSLVVGTGWELPVTSRPVLLAGRYDLPRPTCVAFHSPAPQFEGHEPQGTTCDLWPECYGDTGYTMADEPTALLVRSGSDAVWKWLESAYHDKFQAAVDTEDGA